MAALSATGTRRLGAAAGLLVAWVGAAAPAAAQTGAGSGGGADAGAAPVVAPAGRIGVGGVRSKGARPMTDLGVRDLWNRDKSIRRINIADGQRSPQAPQSPPPIWTRPRPGVNLPPSPATPENSTAPVRQPRPDAAERSFDRLDPRVQAAILNTRRGGGVVVGRTFFPTTVDQLSAALDGRFPGGFSGRFGRPVIGIGSSVVGVGSEGVFFGGFGSGCGSSVRFNRFGSECWSDRTAPIFGPDERMSQELAREVAAQRGELPEAPVAEPLPPLAIGLEALRAGQDAAAIDALADHLAANPRDIRARRAMGLALMGAGRTAEGAGVLMAAYQSDPTLAYVPIEASQVHQGEIGLRSRMVAAMELAGNQRSAEVFFAAAVLAQAEGRIDVARRVLDSAEQAGAEAGAVRELRKVLERKGR